MSCGETAEPIDLPLGLWTWVDRRKHKFNRIRQVAPLYTISIVFARWRQCAHIGWHIGATWQIRLRRRRGLMSNYFDHLLTMFQSHFRLLYVSGFWGLRPDPTGGLPLDPTGGLLSSSLLFCTTQQNPGCVPGWSKSSIAFPLHCL